MVNTDTSDVSAIKHLAQQASEAYLAHDWEQFTSYFTENAVWMPPDQPPLIGKEAWWSWIGKRWGKRTMQQHVINHEEIIVTGNWAFEWHTESQIGEGWQVNFKGIWILQRQDDGQWKIARYCWNISP
jgi:ketosteroid isomerase-like protein